MKFVCLGYIDESCAETWPTDQQQQLMEKCFEYDDQLRRDGHFLGGEALDWSRNAVTLRAKNGSVDMTDGPYAETKEMLGGILLLEARNLEHAVELMSQHPGVQVGPFEIRPADEEVNRMVAQRGAAASSSKPAAVAVNSYLFFGGRCEEALEFYKRAVGAQVEMLMRYRDSPEPPPPGSVPEGFQDKIMHASFRIGDSVVMASDGCGQEVTPSGFSLAVSAPTEAEADRMFAALADGGRVEMPLCETFWSPRFGMLTDRFGVGWMISVQPSPDTAG